MTCIPFEMETRRLDLFSRLRDELAERRRRLAKTLKQLTVVAIVFGLGAAFHLMKWAGVLVL